MESNVILYATEVSQFNGFLMSKGILTHWYLVIVIRYRKEGESIKKSNFLCMALTFFQDFVVARREKNMEFNITV